jgi:hypothetical protein
MLVVTSIKAENLAPNLQKALRTFLSQKSKIYLKFLSTANTLRVCICTNYANLCCLIKAKYQTKLKSSPKVLLNYYTNNNQQKLSNALLFIKVQSQFRYKDVRTQTKAALKNVVYTG